MNGLASIVIVTCNRLKFTRQTLESIFAHTDYPYELIILDNGSKDGTVDYLNSIQDHPQVSQVVLFPTNQGKPGAANHGFVLSKGDYIIGLDDDVVVPPGWLSVVVEALRTVPRIGWIAINLENFGNQPGYFRPEYEHHFGHLVIQETPGVAGFCVAMPRSTYNLLGGYTEGTFYGIEDSDYLNRSRANGLLCGYLMNVIGIHYGGTDYENALYPEYMEYKYKAQEEYLKGNPALTLTDFFAEHRQITSPDTLRQGELIKSEQPATYFVYNGKKYLIANTEVFDRFGLRWEDVHYVSQSALDQIPNGFILR
jgi:GT2 family glycosyltransferase